jgi:hypothetical protein
MSRLDPYRDSREIVDGLRRGKDPAYWRGEAAVHIEGLWTLALTLYRDLHRARRPRVRRGLDRLGRS